MQVPLTHLPCREGLGEGLALGLSFGVLLILLRLFNDHSVFCCVGVIVAGDPPLTPPSQGGGNDSPPYEGGGCFVSSGTTSRGLSGFGCANSAITFGTPLSSSPSWRSPLPSTLPQPLPKREGPCVSFRNRETHAGK